MTAENDTNDNAAPFAAVATRRRRRRHAPGRIDQQPLVVPPELATTTCQPDIPLDRLYRYRDRVLALLSPRVDPELMALLDRRSDRCLTADPFNTVKARFLDGLAWFDYCAQHDQSPIPADADTLQDYLDQLLAQGKRRATIARQVNSLRWWHKLADLDDPFTGFDLQTHLSTVRRQATPAKQLKGIRFAHLKQALTVFNPDILRDCADMALLFTAFDSLCRRSELAAATWADIAADPSDGSGLLHIPRSKTDQDADGAYVYLSATTMRLLDHWRQVSGISTGTVFRGVDSGNRIHAQLSANGVGRAFKRIARRLGLPPGLFSGHSPRIGAAQEMVDNDVDMAAIMLAGRWKGPRMVTHYTKGVSAKQSGAAKLAHRLGTDKPAATPGLPQFTLLLE